MPFIERLASREIYRNPWLIFREDDIRRPDGSPGVYAVVDKPTYALVMPYDGHSRHEGHGGARAGSARGGAR